MGVYLSAPETRKQTVAGEDARITYAATEMQGWRTSMEDAKLVELAVDRTTALAAVFDGHGGKDVSNYAARVFTRELRANRNFTTGNFPEALKETFLGIDELLRTPNVKVELARGSSDSNDGDYIINNSGCTAVVSLICGDTIYVANSGDSRCVLGVKGKALQMSFDHKPELPIETQRISRAGGYIVEGRVMGNLNLSRSLGDLTYKDNRDLAPENQMITADPDIRSATLTLDTDFMVLACDGVWDVLTCDQCVAFIYDRLKQNLPLTTIVEQLLDRCLASDVTTSGGLGCDNMTCVLLRFKH